MLQLNDTQLTLLTYDGQVDLKQRYTLSKTENLGIVVNTLQLWGIACIPNYLNLNELEQIRYEFDELLNVSESWGTAGGGKFDRSMKVRRCELPEAQFPTLSKTFSSSFMEKVCHGYLGESSIFNQFILAKHNFYDKRGDRINDPHFDAIRSLKFFLYLDDTDTSNGAFEYAPGTHNLNREQVAEFRLKGGKVKDTPNVALPHEAKQLVPIDGKAGTLLIFDTDGFHGGGYVHEGAERRVIRSHCYDSPKLQIDPDLFSEQWFRESLLNYRRYLGKAAIPNRTATGGKGRKQSGGLRQKLKNLL